MRWLFVCVSLFLGCQAPVDELVFVLPDGTSAKDVAFDFGGHGGPTQVTALLKNTSANDLELAEPTFEGDVGTAFLVTGLTNQTLAKGGQLSIGIEFVPSATHAGVIRVSSGKGAALASLTLTGSLDSSRCLLPEVVDFGAVLPGERPQRSVEFPLSEVRRDVFVGPPGAPFVLSANGPAGTASIAAGDTLKARVVLGDPGVGEYTASWKLDPGGDCPPREVQLRATVLQHYLSASPTTLDFGVVVPPGQPSATATLLNALSRPVPVTIEVLSAAGGPTTNFRTSLTQLDLPPATRDAQGGWRFGEAQVPVTAWLLGAGTVNGKLVVTTATDDLVVPMVARGAGAGLQVTPSPVDLGDVPEVEGQRLPVATGVALLNDDVRAGASAVTISAITVEADQGSNPADLCVGVFTEATQTCAGFTGPLAVAPGTQSPLPLRAKPTGTGPWKWFVVLHTDDAQQPELRFEVRARLRPMADCTLIQPQSLSFGPVRAPTPMVRPLVLENQGLTPCVVQGLWIDGSPDVRAASSAFTIGAGERRFLDLEYLPATAPGTTSFPTLRYSVNSVSAPVRAVPLEVASDDGCLFVSPEQWDFGVVSPSCGARTQRFGVGNRCTGQEVVVMGTQVTGSAAFTLDGTPPQRLAASSFSANAVRVSFDPTAAAQHAGALEFEVQVATGTRKWRVPLRGIADASGRERDRFVMPSSVDSLLIQDASPGAAELQHGLSLRADSLLALARARRASVRIGGVRADETAATLGQLTQLDGLRWLSLDAATAPQLGVLLDVGSAMVNPIEAFLGPGLAAVSGPVVTGWNAGFVRRGASLNVVSLSNAGEGTAQPLAVVLPQLAAVKGSQRPEWLSWSAVGPFSVATTGCTNDEAAPNALQKTAAAQLGGVVAEHCDVLRDAQLFESSVAPTFFGARDSLSLRAPPAPGALPNVTVGGVAVPELGANLVRNWSFDVTRRAVTFSSLTLRPGDVVELEYPTLCE